MLYILARKWYMLDEEGFWDAPVEFMLACNVEPDVYDLVARSEPGMRIRLTGNLINEAIGEDLCDRFELRACTLMQRHEADIYIATECWPIYPWSKSVTQHREDFPYDRVRYGS